MNANQKTMANSGECGQWQDLRNGMCNWIVPTRLQAILTGVQHVRQDANGTVTATFCNGATDTQNCPDLQIHEMSFFALVDELQSRQRDRNIAEQDTP